MKRFMCVLLVLLMCTAFAEKRPDGSVQTMYRADTGNVLADGWETVRYIESEGLLLAAYCSSADLTVSLESEMSMAAALESIGSYGVILSSSGDDERFTCSYRPKRGTEETVYAVDVYCKEAFGKTLVVTMTCWEGENPLFDELIADLRVTEVQASEEYLALLKSCVTEEKTVQIGLDFVDIDYDTGFGGVIFINEEMTVNSFMPAHDALIYLPDVDSPMYSMRLCTDTDEISSVIREYNGINGQDGLYIVQFDKDNRIIRMQHYNAL